MSADNDLAYSRVRRLYLDQELRLAVYASDDPDCRWLAAWFKDVAEPAWRAGEPACWPLPPGEFAAKMSRIRSVVEREIAGTPAVWSPGPREPLLPGDWPAQPVPRRQRRRRK